MHLFKIRRNPLTLQEALSSPKSLHWMEVIGAEMNLLEHNEV